jgi:hypothetical protein
VGYWITSQFPLYLGTLPFVSPSMYETIAGVELTPGEDNLSWSCNASRYSMGEVSWCCTLAGDLFLTARDIIDRIRLWDNYQMQRAHFEIDTPDNGVWPWKTSVTRMRASEFSIAIVISVVIAQFQDGIATAIMERWNWVGSFKLTRYLLISIKILTDNFLYFTRHH